MRGRDTTRRSRDFWMHNGLVNLAGEKMSKSTKLYFLIEDIAQGRRARGWSASTCRRTHYRSPIEFSLERLTEARTAYQRIRQPMDRFGAFEPDGAGAPRRRAMADAIREADTRVNEAMDDDVNTARAIGHLFDLGRE